MALGRGRTDLLIIWPYPGEQQRVVIELKIRRGPQAQTIAQGLEQTCTYLDRVGAEDGPLVIFDRDKKRSWEEKIFSRVENYRGTSIKVWGM